MDTDRFVVVLIMSPTPTPKPDINVSEVIFSRTTWVPDFVYQVTGDLEVAEGTTLTVKPGTSVKFSGGGLLIAGTLLAEATSEQPINFTSDSSWDGIKFLDSSDNSKIYYSVIEKATGAALDIDAGQLTLRNSVIRSSDVGIWLRSSKTTILRNEIYSNETGVIAGTTANVTLIQNTIRNNVVGIRVVGPAFPLVIRESNILANLEFNILVVGFGCRSTDAAGNWWSTVDGVAIEGTIHHKNDDASLSTVTYEPFAVGPISEAP